MRRVEARLADDQHQQLRAWCQSQDRELSWAMRKAVEAWLRSPAVQAVGDLNAWKADPGIGSLFATVPPSSVVYLRSAHSSEGGHEISVGGRRLWVLPDGRTSGQRRSRLITQALAACEQAAGSGVDPLAHVYGLLALAQAGVLLYRGTE